ncbi:hypothetical protein AVEN_141045-1 [Araneus ventricosus]|uniref:Uncharacterized protein n=1 Tax=Araneus ventricosus TaxID=182803 RepID=A0A4Y2TWH1_ARAVE|nr:hypothetical protein AVEN_141045-1 [Araneus ventricosus]
MNDNSLNTETGVLVAINGHGATPNPKKVRIIPEGVIQPHNYYTPRRGNPLIYARASQPRTPGAPPPCGRTLGGDRSHLDTYKPPCDISWVLIWWSGRGRFLAFCSMLSCQYDN